jgi:hypothetical protein
MVLIEQEAGWGLRLVWMGTEDLAPPRFDSCNIQPIASHYTNYTTPAHPLLSKETLNGNFTVICFVDNTYLTLYGTSQQNPL